MTESDGWIDMSRGVPPTNLLPQEKVKQCAMDALENYGDKLLQYHSDLSTTVRGFDPLIELLADQMGEGAKPDNILVGNGSLDVYDILVNALTEEGDDVLVEEPSYDRAITTLKRAGTNVEGIPLEKDGVDIEKLESTVREKDVKLMYVVADFQNPSGVTTSEEKRKKLVELAKEFGFWVIEDSPYHKLRYKGEDKPLIWEGNPDKVIYMSSYSKLISPGLRCGWTVIPPQLTGPVYQYAEDSYITPSMLSQGVVYEFLKKGWLKDNLEILKEPYTERLDTLLEALEAKLPEADWTEPEGGFFVGLYLPEGNTYEDLAENAEELKLNFSDSRKFFPEKGDVNFLRIPFCSLAPEEIKEAIDRLSNLLI